MSIFTVTLRGQLLRPRAGGLLALSVVVAAVAIIIRSTADDAYEAYAELSGRLLVPLVIALISLIVGVNAFGDEREDGTMPLLIATCTPRWRMTLEKTLAAMLATWLICLPATLGLAIMGAGADLSGSKVFSSVVGASVLAVMGYVSVFVLLSLVLNRAVLVGMGYVVLWEGVIANYANGARSLSIGAYGRRVLASGMRSGDIPFTVPDVATTTAVIVPLVVAAIAVSLAAIRLPHVEVR
ncbi:MAG TPA: ABC transporter permease subunit [Mycobacteriales bacterium]|nr:ABC transporter permease subunit [Mycobacteriales bacterium]